ncbi:hypothetical protein Hanom_Chr03g00248451 [Helianthus anomalus]
MSHSSTFSLVKFLGGDCFFRCKTSAVCGPHLQASAGEEVDQRPAVCKERRVFFTSKKELQNTHNTQHTIFNLN